MLGGATRALIDGNPFPNAPEMTADITARYSMPFGADGEFFVFTDWAWQGDTNLFLYESTEFQTDGQFEGGLKLGWARTDGTLESRSLRPQHHGRGQHQGRHRLQQQHRLRQRTAHRRRLGEE